MTSIPSHNSDTLLFDFIYSIIGTQIEHTPILKGIDIPAKKMINSLRGRTHRYGQVDPTMKLEPYKT